MSRFLFLLFWLTGCVCVVGCSRGPSAKDAAVWLAAPESWDLKEVVVNGKPVYKDGQVIEQFGEVSFSRYMDKVSFSPGGKFTGRFAGDAKTYVFNWSAQDDAVVVADTVARSGQWTIPYRTLKENSFYMETETTAFDPPNVTRIRLHFEK